MRSRPPEAGRSARARRARHYRWPRTFGSILLCLLPALVPLVAPALARAAPATEAPDRAARARVVAKQALAAYRLGRYEQAIERYQAAHRILAEPRYLYALGTSYQKLGRFGPALAYLERFVKASKDPAGALLRQRAAKRIAEIRRTTSLVTLDVAPAGARVQVDGQPALIAPIRERQRLPNGEHRVTATLADHRRVEKRFQVGPRSSRLVLRLLPRIQPRRRDVPGPGPGPGPKVKPGARGLRVAGWTSIALFGASVVVAGVLGSLSLRAKQKVDAASQGTMWEPELSSANAAVGRYRTGAWVAGGLGAALLITGVVLLVVDGKRRPERRVWLQPAVGPGRVTLSLGLRL